MTERIEYLIVGSGLTGATIARVLTDAGHRVLVLERRAHLGGNVHDHLHSSGIRIQTYGPHTFRTGSDRIWNYVRRFGNFFDYQAEIKTLVDGRIENWPIAASYVRRAVGEDWQPGFRGKPHNFEQASLRLMPRVVYEKFIKGYTEKQWGVPASALDVSLAKRIEFRPDDDPYLVHRKYQALPRDGYAAFMCAMLEGIPVYTGVDYLRQRKEFLATRKLIFTGPIDEFFDFELGRLAYRGQVRTHAYFPDTATAQSYFQINNPDPANGAHIRTLEWKHLMPRAQQEHLRGTVLTRETPFSPTDPNQYEYPFPDAANAALYARYRKRADALPDVLICGRLGEYRYYDMDQAIARALMLARRLLQETHQVEG